MYVFIIESQNILRWKEPIRIIETNSLLLPGLPKTKPCDLRAASQEIYVARSAANLDSG